MQDFSLSTNGIFLFTSSLAISISSMLQLLFLTVVSAPVSLFSVSAREQKCSISCLGMEDVHKTLFSFGVGCSSYCIAFSESSSLQ